MTYSRRQFLRGLSIVTLTLTLRPLFALRYASPVAQRANTIYAGFGGDDANTGLTYATRLLSVQRAMRIAKKGDKVFVVPSPNSENVAAF